MTINIGGGELKEIKPRILVMGRGGAGDRPDVLGDELGVARRIL